MKTNYQPDPTDIRVTRIVWFCIGFILALVLIYMATPNGKY